MFKTTIQVVRRVITTVKDDTHLVEIKTRTFLGITIHRVETFLGFH